jgi:hypothetical protein
MRNFSLTVLGLFALVSCASQRPILYPDEQLKRVGSNMAGRDIEDCMRQAEQYVSDRRVGKAVAGSVTESGTSAAIGAAAGAAGEAVVGRAGTSAPIGAAGGGAAGVTRGVLHVVNSKHSPPPVYKNFVDRCLRERGYEPIGWD